MDLRARVCEWRVEAVVKWNGDGKLLCPSLAETVHVRDQIEI